MSGFQRSSGFTLLELIITIIVLSIVASFAVPSFRETIMNNRLTAQINEASSLISYARSEASKLQSGVVTVCSSTDNASCSGNAAWETGWIVFRDIDGDRAVDTADGDELLKVGNALSGGNSFRIRGLTSNGGGFIQFASNGFPIPPAGGSAAGTIMVCDSRGVSDARAIVLGVAGQVRLARNTDGSAALNGNDTDGDGNDDDITCP
jgi:type IV fimbrial biogenesis protein FimT